MHAAWWHGLAYSRSNNRANERSCLLPIVEAMMTARSHTDDYLVR